MGNREHGGNLDAAIARYGGAREDWLDLSTGINPVAWPVPELSPDAWTRLPEPAAMEGLLQAARTAYGVAVENGIVAAAGAQALIQLLPVLTAGNTVRILSPTYNEYAATYRNGGVFQFEEVREFDDLRGADVAVLVNPNNPDGKRHDPADLTALAAETGILIVDEAFADPHPELSLCPTGLPENVLVLRSFGKFFGLAGLRLGFLVAHPDICEKARQLLGPWSVSGPAIEVGASALRDQAWQRSTCSRLSNNMNRLVKLFDKVDLEIVGATDLFATVSSADAFQLAEMLAARKILVRTFSYQTDWIRFGLPADEAGWGRLSDALGAA